ncbi:Similar to S.cerevisiae protein YAK1 (Serine-threonine protein kinase) [Malassezia sympodialis ATCC 42132]|uniref:Similar to S.cerevisiae protein YAK1 (Serine-threonine protein kinase) n=1 Tax=Malassezia sympodialis (strain ATCC 42132) TaxID=1230383 RepID=A0A1M8A302_MALS4|nr:Similar to S.cerevisiae protein YAK1 (Serine-threonine protein kinase) [Malassezia sympodialis ATCC 42132]
MVRGGHGIEASGSEEPWADDSTGEDSSVPSHGSDGPEALEDRAETVAVAEARLMDGRLTEAARQQIQPTSDTAHYAGGPAQRDSLVHMSASTRSPSPVTSSSSSSIESTSMTEVVQGRETASSTTSTAASMSMRMKRPGQPQFEGFWQVQSLEDLRPMTDIRALCDKQRRADPAGGLVSPLKALTSYLHHTYHMVNPAFVYELAFNPRRVLTKPSKPMYNDGHDNEDSDYILYVNDYLGGEDGHRYLILDVLGQGTFGQVVKCQNMTTHDIVAVKVIKNKPAYFNQSMMEVTILETLNQHWDPDDRHNILRLQDTFIHHKHLCLVFELLSSNLYELIKQNSFRGLSTSLVRVFVTQLLDALVVLKDARLIHCDLKPENILLRTLQTPSIKLVDFGSACHEEQTVYTYIQSRFYRSPEVLLGLSYTAAIDMWSLGCIAAELFLGLPIFPGTSEYNQISRIVHMLGVPPAYMMERGRQTREFFNVHTDSYGRLTYQLKPMDQYSREHRVQEQASKQYFPGTTLPEIIRLTPMPRRSGRAADTEKEMANRAAFTDFVAGLLNLNPLERWTPQQAKQHPFITGEPFTQPWVPPRTTPPQPAPPSAAAEATAAASPAIYEDTVSEDPYAVAQPYARAQGKRASYISPPGSRAYGTDAPSHTIVGSPSTGTHHMYDREPAYSAGASLPVYATAPAASVVSHEPDAAWTWSPAGTPLASVRGGATAQATPMYPAGAPAGFSVVVHGNEPYGHTEQGGRRPFHNLSPAAAQYSVPYGPTHDTTDTMNDPYAQAPRYAGPPLHDDRRMDPNVLPMYVNRPP